MQKGKTMAKNETRRIPSALLSADREAFDALQGIDNYTPANAAYTTASIKALHDRMDDLQREATQAQADADAKRDAAIAGEWAFHNAMLGAKVQVNGTLRVALFLGFVVLALAASAPSLTASKAAPGVKSAARTQANAQAAASPTPQRDERLWQRALAIHRKAIIVDGHNDIPTIMVDENYDLGTPSAGKYHTDLQRLKQSGMTGEFFSIYVDRQYATPEWVAKNYVTEGGSSRRALDLIDMTYRMVEKYPKDLMLAASTADIRRAKKEGKVGVLMGIEGGHAIENSLSALREFYRLGVRYMTLTHNNTNEWADACCDEARHNGLTDFGKDVVREMNRLGMFADISHVSDKTMSDVLDVSKAPVIASHSSARVYSNHRRNIPDDLLKRIGQNGGVVMVNFYTD